MAAKTAKSYSSSTTTTPPPLPKAVCGGSCSGSSVSSHKHTGGVSACQAPRPQAPMLAARGTGAAARGRRTPPALPSYSRSAPALAETAPTVSGAGRRRGQLPIPALPSGCRQADH